MKYSKDGKKKNLRNFYIAAAICLVAVGGIVVATVANGNNLETQVPEESITTTKRSIPTTSTTTPDASVDNVVTGIQDEHTEAAAKPTETPTEPAAEANTQPALFVLPLTNEVIKEFSDGKLVYSNTMKDWRVHNGVDFKGDDGQEVKALADGTITAIEEDVMWGRTITIDHGLGITSKYCGVNAEGIVVDDKVEVGSVIGFLSAIPCESEDGPHLHLEITKDGNFIDSVAAIGTEVRFESID